MPTLILCAVPWNSIFSQPVLDWLDRVSWIPAAAFVPIFLFYVIIEATIKGWPKTSDQVRT